MTTPAQFAEKAQRCSTLLPPAVRNGLRQVGAAGARTAAQTGGRLRNMGRGGIQLKASPRLLSESVLLRPVPKGPWTIAESGAGPHLIGITGRARGRGRNRRRSTVFLKGAGYGHPVRGPVAHPGARGRGVWTKTRTKIEKDAARIIHRAIVSDALGKVF